MYHISVTVLYPSGDIEVSTIIDGERIACRYQGYTKAQAKALFIRKYL